MNLLRLKESENERIMNMPAVTDLLLNAELNNVSLSVNVHALLMSIEVC